MESQWAGETKNGKQNSGTGSRYPDCLGSVDGTQNRGMIAFEPMDFERTRITLTMEYEPEGLLERAGDVLGIPSSQVEGDLKRFRDFIEKREMETGGWRSQIENGKSVDSTSGISRSEDPLDVKNGDDIIKMESGETPSLRTETREAELGRGQRGTEEMSAAEDLPLEMTGSNSEFLNDETAPLIDDPASEKENSQFYREAGVLAPSYEQIAQRAYELYEARGRIEGHAQEDWLEAEKQLAKEMREL